MLARLYQITLFKRSNDVHNSGRLCHANPYFCLVTCHLSRAHVTINVQDKSLYDVLSTGNDSHIVVEPGASCSFQHNINCTQAAKSLRSWNFLKCPPFGPTKYAKQTLLCGCNFFRVIKRCASYEVDQAYFSRRCRAVRGAVQCNRLSVALVDAWVHTISCH